MAGPAHDPSRAGPSLGNLFRPPFAAAVNHLLKTASWASQRLSPHAGKTARFDLAPFSVALTIRDTGDVADSPSSAVADASFRLTPGIALRVLAADENAWREVQVSGDTAFARDIHYVVQNLRWDVEEDLSGVFGDIAAHRIAQAGRDFQRWQRASTEHLARSATAYWTEERPLVATRRDIETFLHDVDVLRDDVARIEKRIERAARGASSEE